MMINIPEIKRESKLSEYTLVVQVDHGASRGFGFKSPESSTLTEKINAECDFDAILLAIKRAVEFANNYLSNPDTNLTKAVITSISRPNGIIDQSVVLSDAYIRYPKQLLKGTKKCERLYFDMKSKKLCAESSLLYHLFTM